MSTVKANNNVEDILASIRSSIADESGFRGHRGNAVPLRRDMAVAEEAADFELPSIFKTTPPQPQPVKPNILGRLSEALKSGPDGDNDRSRTVVRFEPLGGHRMIEPPAASKSAPPRQPSAPVEEDPVEKAQRANDGVARVMTSFFDTRLNRMGELSSSSTAPANTEPAQPEPAPAQPAPAQPGPAAFSSSPTTPPSLPNFAAADSGSGDPMEDAAAQLLRPMLRQWLTENMPKIVERALRNETDLGLSRQVDPTMHAGPTIEDLEVRKTFR